MKPLKLDAVNSMSNVVMTAEITRTREMSLRLSVAGLLIAMAARVMNCRFVITHEWPSDPDGTQRRPPPDIKPDPETMASFETV